MVANSRELIQGLRDGFSGLGYGDEKELNRLNTRGDMLIRRVFGESSRYLSRFSRIGFHALVSPISEAYERQVWEKGRNATLDLLDTMLEDLELSQADVGARTSGAASPELSNRVFVVHGHDDEMKVVIARVLERLGLKPVVLHEQPDRGRTIIEKFTGYSDVGFAVVLLSPDDIGYSKDEPPANARPRARQNVILELGYFVGRLGRENVLALVRKKDGDLEFPSDYSGVLYTSFLEDSWQLKLVRELKASGYAVSADDLP